MLPETNVANAAIAAEHLRAQVAATPFPGVPGGLAVTASFGVAGLAEQRAAGLDVRCAGRALRRRRVREQGGRPELRHRPADGLIRRGIPHASVADRRVCRGRTDRPDRHRPGARRRVRRSERLSRRHREAGRAEDRARADAERRSEAVGVSVDRARDRSGVARRRAGLRPGAVRLDPGSARRRAAAAAPARQDRSRQRAARRRAHPADHRRERPRQLGGSRQERDAQPTPQPRKRRDGSADDRRASRSATRRS